mmetsp:Transcript_42634/g.109161  ORF Transcript_42634/g.109161 Transcript_42634/m.109161 type:complete len:699 (-) Transcript_42634:261-2357(-)
MEVLGQAQPRLHDGEELHPGRPSDRSDVFQPSPGSVQESQPHLQQSTAGSRDLFWTYAADFDKALLRFTARAHGGQGGAEAELDMLEHSRQFGAILEVHGFKGQPFSLRCCKLEESSSVSMAALEGEDLNWVKTNDGKKCLHVEIVHEGGDEAVRPLPVLLMQVASLTGGGTYCAWVVGEAAYLNQSLPRDGVWLWFPFANTELINDEFWEQLGYSREVTPVYPPHKPASWTNKIDPTSLQQALNNFQVMECTQGAVPYDLRVLYSKTGEDTNVCLRCQATPVVWSCDGKVVALMGCHTDVSADNKDHLTKISFIGKISHEIRTPLNALCGAYEVLSEHMADAPPKTREAWDMLSSATAQVRMVVDDVLDYSALSAGKMALHKTAVPLEDLLAESLRMHSSAAEKKGVTLSMSASSAPPNVLVDQARMQQVLCNLLSNAIKFTSEGGTVNMVASTLPNRLSSSMVYFNIDVVDTGRGIPRAHWDSVFEDFNQARLGDSCVGTGLGLAICSMLVGLHGGKIFVKESQMGVGTTVRIQLETPVEIAALPVPRVRALRPTSSQGTTRCETMSLGSVLVVDDTRTNIIVIKALLKKIDPTATILVAENGKMAVSLALENEVNFVLMDIHMPVLDGIEATKFILARKPYLPVIGLTANTDAELEVLCRQIGMRDVMLKPTTRPILKRTLAWIMAASTDALAVA